MERPARTVTLANHRLCQKPGSIAGEPFGRSGSSGKTMNPSPSKVRIGAFATACGLIIVLLLNACGSGNAPSFQSADSDASLPGAPAAAQALGERLFLDTRF